MEKVELKVEVKSSIARKGKEMMILQRFTWTKLDMGRTYLLCVVYNKLSFYLKNNDANGTSDPN